METTSKTPSRSATLYLCLVLISSLWSATDAQGKKTINVKNNCGFDVWPGISTGHESLSVPQDFPPLLKAGESHSSTVDRNWIGNIWGRQECTFNEASGTGHCEAGDCGGKLRCEANDYPENGITLAVLNKDSYAITLATGYNLPMSVVPSSSTEKCGSQQCTANVAAVCPKQLQVKSQSSGEVIGCKGECDHYTTLTCTPPEYGNAFGPVCPTAFPFEFFQFCTSSTFYTVTFCP